MKVRALADSLLPFLLIACGSTNAPDRASGSNTSPGSTSTQTAASTTTTSVGGATSTESAAQSSAGGSTTQGVSTATSTSTVSAGGATTSGGSGGTAGAGGTLSAGATTAAAGGAGGAGGSGGGGGSGGTSNGPCDDPNLLLCDDFEAADSSWPESSPWVIQLNGQGTVELDTTNPAHSGTHSIHVRGNDNDYQTLFVLKGDPLPVAGRRFYLRVYIRLAEAMSPGHNTYFKAGLYPDGSGNDDYETRVGVQEYQLDINQQLADRGYLANSNYYTDGVVGPGLVAGEWGCVEVLFDHANTEIDVWLDGEEVSGLHHTDWVQDDYDTLSFGYEKYAGPAADIWYDDIAVSTEPIGCF